MAQLTPRGGMMAQARAYGAGTAQTGWPGSRPPPPSFTATDPLMPVGSRMRLARLIPGARYVELAGVGHLVPQEAGAEITRSDGAPDIESARHKPHRSAPARRLLRCRGCGGFVTADHRAWVGYGRRSGADPARPARH